MHRAARVLRMTLAGLSLALAAGASLAQAAPKAAQKAAPKAVPPELPVETLQSGGNLSATTTERIYVADVAISHIVDGRMRVFNATDGKLLGIINSGAAVLADGRPVLVGVDGTFVVGDAVGESFRLRRLDDRATLTATVALPGGGLVASSSAGPRRPETPTKA